MEYSRRRASLLQKLLLTKRVHRKEIRTPWFRPLRSAETASKRVQHHAEAARIIKHGAQSRQEFRGSAVSLNGLGP